MQEKLRKPLIYEHAEKYFMQLPTIAIIMTGVVSFASAIFGLYQSFSVLLSGPIQPHLSALNDKYTYFYPVLYSMTVVNIGCYFILGWCGLDQVRSQVTHVKLFIGLFAFELGYALIIGRILFDIPDIGNSIAAAAGVVIPRLMLPFFILLPFWGSILLLWSKKSLRENRAG